ncbi:hypothetical protein [Saprospira grandis]|uniref:hypothetical protein n=1 Tax=Saprospira grandis TaxID=1008 RepID=UPI0022DE9047|nr:hypothetical protein [Saprospira grandis]WBM75065.1 hypothetical protein OP864_02260 [Saprospira grandis]
MQLIPKPAPNFFNYLLSIGILALLLGRSWQAAFADLPWRAFFWNQAIWQPFLEEEDYLLFFQEDYINFFSWGMAIFWTVCALLLPFFKQRLLAYAASMSLLFLALLFALSKNLQAPQFWEYSLQVCWPLLFVLTARQKWLLWATGICFTAHACYALGLYPPPVDWLNYCMNFLHLSAAEAKDFLFFMGLLDILAVALLFWPKSRNLGLIYCFSWGLITALARPLANSYAFLDLGDFALYFSEFLVRFPHFLGPLYLLLFARR